MRVWQLNIIFSRHQKELTFYYLEKNAAELGELSVYLIHGDADITVPIPSSNRLYEACCSTLGEDSIQYRVVPDMGHASDPLYSDEILSEIDAFLQQKLS